MDIQIPPCEGDAVRLLLDALHQACREPGSRISFTKGCYHFYPDWAEERVSCVSNHDNDGYKKIGLLVERARDLTIDGGGASFIFHGIMMPFELLESKNITLKNFSIDFPVTMLAHGTVLAAGESFCDIELWENTPYHIENGRLFFELDGGFCAPYWGALEFDREKECVAYQTNDRDYFQSARAEELEPGKLRLLQEFQALPTVGNIFVINFGKRFAPGIFIDRCQDIRIENVTIHHCLGMGVLAQLSGDIVLSGLQVTPSEGRFASAYADGVHFVNCSGDIVLEACKIEKQMDDPLNCHGIYARVEEIKDPKTLLLKLMQGQQLGVEIFQAESHVGFINSKSLLPCGGGEIAGVRIISRGLMEVELKDTVPESVSVGDCVENRDTAANLTVRDSYFGKNRARGLLITTAGHVLVENNVFEKAGAAIRISGDANFWFESGCVQDVVIRGNQFKNCNANPRWGRAAIDIAPEIQEPDEKQGCYHSNILIEDNRFELFNPAVLWAKSVENLVVRGNRYIKSELFPAYGEIKEHVTLLACKNPEIQKSF